MNHVFLTGNRNAGKSFLVNKLASNFSRIAGFRTVSVFKSGLRYVYIVDVCSKNLTFTSENLVAICNTGGAIELFSQNFDKFANLHLSNICSENTDLIVFDEIGRLENDSLIFQNAILDILNCDEVPVLGVIQNSENSILRNKILNHPNCQIFNLELFNQDDVFESVHKLLLK